MGWRGCAKRKEFVLGVLVLWDVLVPLIPRSLWPNQPFVAIAPVSMVQVCAVSLWIGMISDHLKVFQAGAILKRVASWAIHEEARAAVPRRRVSWDDLERVPTRQVHRDAATAASLERWDHEHVEVPADDLDVMIQDQ